MVTPARHRRFSGKHPPPVDSGTDAAPGMGCTLPLWMSRGKRPSTAAVFVPLTVLYLTLAVILLRTYSYCNVADAAFRYASIAEETPSNGFYDAPAAVSVPVHTGGDAGAWAPASVGEGVDVKEGAAEDGPVVTAGGGSSAENPVDGKDEVDGLKYGPLPPCNNVPKGPARSWIMVFMGHSGSTAMVSELKQHSGVHFELPEPVDHGERAANATAAYEYVREFFARGLAKGLSPGFKMRPAHILNPEMAGKWAALAREFDTRILWQYRENVFKQSVGEYSHRYLNDTSVVEGIRDGMTREERCKVGAGCRFRVDNFDFFHRMLRDQVNNDGLISRAVESITNGSADCTLALPYEAYLYDREQTMGRVFDFLGLAPEDHPPDRAKATSDSMCDAVENYEDLCREFYGCHVWRDMMDDFRNKCYCSMFKNAGPGKATRCATSI